MECSDSTLFFLNNIFDRYSDDTGSLTLQDMETIFETSVHGVPFEVQIDEGGLNNSQWIAEW